MYLLTDRKSHARGSKYASHHRSCARSRIHEKRKQQEITALDVRLHVRNCRRIATAKKTMPRHNYLIAILNLRYAYRHFKKETGKTHKKNG
jgi:hypothetical protein